jgi:hypothetical protein
MRYVHVLYCWLLLSLCGQGLSLGHFPYIFSWFRGHFCDPSDTADRECTVPFSDNATETQWCVENYNSTDCSSIRNSAQSVGRPLQGNMVLLLDDSLAKLSRSFSQEMETWILGFYYINASVGLLLICLVRRFFE